MVRLYNDDCFTIMKQLKEEGIKVDAIICDPPYSNTTQYNSMTFNSEEFWQIMREWSKDNIVLISEENAPDDFECIWEQEVSRSLNAANKTRATEKLFRYRGEGNGILLQKTTNE